MIDSAQLYQMAVQIQIAAAVQLVQIQAGTQAVIRVVLVPSHDAVFTAVVNRRDTRHAVHQRVAQGQIPLISQRAGQTVNIVVVYEVIQRSTLIDAAVSELAVDAVVDFKIVFVIVGGVDALIALIVGNAVQHLRVCPTLVVAVDDLTHEPEFRIAFLAEIMDAAEKVEVHAVCGIKANAVNVELVHPHAYGIDQIVTHVPVFQIQLYQVVVAVPALVPEVVAAGALSAEVQAGEPVAVLRGLSLFLYVLKCPEVPSHVVEYAVQDNADAVLVQFVTDVGEHLVGAQSAVNDAVVCGVIAVLYGFEHRAEVNGIYTHFLQVGNPVQYLFQSVYRLAALVELRCAAESQGIDVIHHCIFIPIHFLFLLLLLEPVL